MEETQVGPPGDNLRLKVSQPQDGVRLWPLPRAVRFVVPLLALTSLAPFVLGAPLVPDAINGGAAATTFQIFGMGLAIEGAAFDWTESCGECFVRFTTPTGGVTVGDPSDIAPFRTLGPGQYEFREYRGAIGIIDSGPRNFFLEFHGTGKAIQLS